MQTVLPGIRSLELAGIKCEEAALSSVAHSFDDRRACCRESSWRVFLIHQFWVDVRVSIVAHLSNIYRP